MDKQQPKAEVSESLLDTAKAYEAVGKAAQEALWHDVSIEVKIERVRRALLSLESMITSTTKYAHEAFNVAHIHEHGSKGQVVVNAAYTARDPWGHPAQAIISGGDLGYEMRHIFGPLK